MADNLQPTSKQLRELRRLADATGTTFSPPRTRADASQSITALRKRQRLSRIERTVERRDVVRTVQEGTLASAPRPDDIVGYGSTARWANGSRS
jgi:hypothetical protein